MILKLIIPPMENMTTKLIDKEVDLQKKTVAFLKKHEKHIREIEELHRLQIELEDNESDTEEDKIVHMYDYSFFYEDDDRYWSIDFTEHDPVKNPELPEMKMEPTSNVKKSVKSDNNLITEKDVERCLKMSIFHFPKAPMLYANGVAISDKPLESSKGTSDYSVKFKFTITPSVRTIRRRSLVFGKNPKTKKRLSMPGAYILLDERKNIVGYEFDRNFRGEPVSEEIDEYHWDFSGFDFENAFLEKPTEYMSEELIHRLLKKGYVFFPSRPHLKNMTLSNLNQFRSNIREDGLINVKDLIPENGSNQTYIFTQPGLIYDLPCISEWDDQRLLKTSEPTLKIVVAKEEEDRACSQEFKIIGYRVEQ